MSRRSGALLAVGLLPALVAAGVYANTLGNGLALDDPITLRALHSWDGGGAGGWHVFLLRPRALTWAVHRLDERLWGDWAPGFHLTNLVLHAIASSLAAYCALALTRSRGAAILCGLLFAVHPVHVEAVASFANRKDILAMIFVSVSLLLWLDARGGPTRYLASLGCVALAFSAKEIAAAGFVPMLFLADILLRREDPGPAPKRLGRALLRSAPLWLLALVATLWFAGDLSHYFEDSTIDFQTEGYLRNYRDVLATAAASVPQLFRLLVLPLTLSADYPLRVPVGFSDPSVRLGLDLLILWTLAALLLARRAPLATFAMLWVVVTYLPASNVVPVIHFAFADRFLYVPSFGLCLLVAMAFDAAVRFAWRRDRPAIAWGLLALAATLVGAGALRSALRNRDWRDDYTLAKAALDAGMETWRVHKNVAAGLYHEANYAGAALHLRRAVELQPRAPELRYELATVLVTDGWIHEAEGQIRSAAALGELPQGFPSQTLEELGLAFLRQGMPAAAAVQFRRAVELGPDPVQALEGLAWLLAASPNGEARDPGEAVGLAERAVRATGSRDARALCSLAAARAETGDLDGAALTAREALAVATSRGDEPATGLSRAMLAQFERHQTYRISPREISEALSGPVR
jgi:protein O-mannosyl-transferase